VKKLNKKLNQELKAYASRFTSYLIQELGEKIQEVDHIILYGSVARETADSESDIDLFIDTKADLKEKIEDLLEEFRKTRDHRIYRAKGINNEIRPKIGELKNWKELQRSIISTGKVLWGDFKATERPIDTKHRILIYWGNIGKSRSSFLNKLYGFKTKGKKRKGLLEEWNGKKTGKSSILIPFKHKKEAFDLLEKHNVDAKTIELFTTD